MPRKVFLTKRPMTLFVNESYEPVKGANKGVPRSRLIDERQDATVRALEEAIYYQELKKKAMPK